MQARSHSRRNHKQGTTMPIHKFWADQSGAGGHRSQYLEVYQENSRLTAKTHKRCETTYIASFYVGEAERDLPIAMLLRVLS